MPQTFPSSRFLQFGTLALAGALCGGQVQAQDADLDLNALSLDELMNMKVDVSSNTEKTIREQPGIVSVVTAEEIRVQGARDLLEVLQFVPGFNFGTDIGGIVGPTFRGLWAYEGKTQLIVDGIEMNEGIFGTVPINRHYPAELIRQIEIIRGPGAALYGGTAELNVIKISTKGAELNGAFGQGTVSVTDGGIAQQYAFVSGYTLDNELRLSLSGSFRDDYLSNETYRDLDPLDSPTSYDMGDNTALQPWNLNLGVGYRGFQSRIYYDYYDVEAKHSVGPVNDTVRQYEFRTLGIHMEYEGEVNDWLKLTPKFTIRDQSPWKRTRPTGVQQIEATRMTGSLTANMEFSDTSNLMAGTEAYLDHGYAQRLENPNNLATYFNGESRSVRHEDWALYAQYEQDFKVVNLTVGGRYEDHSALDSGAFVPRVGLTKAWDSFHTKLLYSQAFRTPNIRVINEAVTYDPGSNSYNPSTSLEAEKTDSYELELGYKFSSNWNLVGNLFYLEVEEPYIYWDAAGGYLHDGVVSSYGLELELRHSASWGMASVGYSLYRADQTEVPLLYADEDSFLGVPNQKLTASVTFFLTKDLSWNVSGIINGETQAAVIGDPDADSDFYPVGSYDAVFLLNTYAEYLFRGFNFGLGVNDLLNQGRAFYQPYNGGGAPLPDKSFEVYAKVGYKF